MGRAHRTNSHIYQIHHPNENFKDDEFNQIPNK